MCTCPLCEYVLRVTDGNKNGFMYQTENYTFTISPTGFEKYTHKFDAFSLALAHT